VIGRLPDEHPQEHLAFLEWLAHTSPRPVPNPSLAPEHNWTERANAYDALCAPDADPGEQLRLAARTEVGRLVRSVLGGERLPLKDLATLIEICGSLPSLAPSVPKGPHGGVDLATLTTEEVNTLARVAAKAEQQEEIE
jgi:hypothetical protein